MPPTMSLEAGTEADAQDARDPAEPSRKSLPSCRSTADRTTAATPRRSQCRVLRAAEALRRVAARADQRRTDRRSAEASSRRAFTGVSFNFSQYIQDNIEEAISGVKGANSVKIIGPDLTKLEELADQVMRANGPGPRRRGPRHLPRARPAQPQHHGRPRQGGPLRAQHRRCEYRGPGRHGRHRGDHTCSRATAFSTSPCVWRREYRNSIEAIGDIKVGYQTIRRRNAYIPLRELATITLDTGASYIYHEAMNRYIPIKFSVRGRDLGSTVAEAQERIAHNVKFPRGYRLEWAGEFEDLQHAQARLAVFVPMSLALILILLYSLFNSVRDSLLALGGHSLRDRRWLDCAVRHGPALQRFGGDRIHLAVRRLGDERHPGHHLLQSAPARRHVARRCHVPGRRKAHAADADDGSVGLHRPGCRPRFRRVSAARCSARWPPWSSAACCSGRSCCWSSCRRCSWCFCARISPANRNPSRPSAACQVKCLRTARLSGAYLVEATSGE